MCVWYRISLHSPGCPRTQNNLPAYLLSAGIKIMSQHAHPQNIIFKLSSKPQIERRRKYGIGRNEEKEKYSINKIKHTVSEEVNLPWIGLYSHPIPDTPDFGILRSKLRGGTLKMCIDPESPSLMDRVMGGCLSVRTEENEFSLPPHICFSTFYHGMRQSQAKQLQPIRNDSI